MCNLAIGKTAYVLLTFDVAHDFGILWKQRGYLTSFRQRIKNSSYALELLKASHLHKTLGITKIPGHSITNMEKLELTIWLILLLSYQH